MRLRFAGWAAGPLLALSLCPKPAEAQQLEPFALNRFEPAPAGDRFFGVQGGDPGGRSNVYAMLLGNYAYRPLVLYGSDGEELGSVVSDQLFLHGSLSLALFERLLLSVDVPIALVTEGESPETDELAFNSPSGTAFGDIRLGGRLRLVGKPRSPFELSLAGYLWLPTGDEGTFAGEGTTRGMPALVAAGEAGSFVYAVNAGTLLRPNKPMLSTEVGSELTFGAAAGVLLANRKVQIGLELQGSTTFEDTFSDEATNFESLLGLKARLGSFVLGAGAGPGFGNGPGTPSLRAVASIAYVPENQPAPKPPSDRDRDGILDRVDACPDVAGEPNDDPDRHGCPPDQDGDGILDGVDACVDEPGEANEDPKKHGCPPDKDGDGIADGDDACVDEPGEASEDPKKHGCPPDKDGDGIADGDDACPDVKGVPSSDPEKNGCPPDTDGDGITDDRDACPREKGKPNPDPEKNGCPEMVRVTESEIVILQQVQFKTASDQILPASDALLTEVAAVLREHPEIELLEVQGHTDDRGTDKYNKNLSQRRAASVVKWLTTKGELEAGRLQARGYGEEQPIADNDTEEGRQKNRRVQFKIVRSNRDRDGANEGSQP